jgi:drug/metabolite transporter (DMT)-like permease
VTPGTALALMVLVVLWASAFPAIKLGLEGLGPGHLTLARHLVASAAFVPFLLVARARLLPRRADLAALLGLGVVGISVYHLALNTGEQRVSAGATSLLIATAPALTAVVAWLVQRDRLGPLGWTGTALGLVGVALIASGDGGVALGWSTDAPVGGPLFEPYALLIVLAAFATAVFAVVQRPLLRRYRPLEFTAYVTWAGTLPLVVFAPGLSAALAEAGPTSLLATLHLGVFPSAVAYTLFALALSRAPATAVTAWLYLIPGFALLFSWWWLGEVPSALTLVGGAVVVVGVVLVQRSKRRGAPPITPAVAPR